MSDLILPPILSVKKVHLELDDVEILEEFDFEIPAKAFLSIIGPNGSGKTSLVKTMMGLITPTRGQIKMDTRRIGYMPQIKTLDRSFPATSLELVWNGLRSRWPFWIPEADEVRCLEALRHAGVENLAQRAVSKLSGGELQRVYLARALVREPEILFLDEPATGIDRVGEENLYDLLSDYQRIHDSAIVMVTHDLDVASHHATHVLLMNRKQLAFGHPKQVLTSELLRFAFGHIGHHHD